MYYQFAQQMHHSLGQLDHCLVVAETYATFRGFDVNNLFAARLAPDMLPFFAQVRIACDGAKSLGAQLAGQTPPRHEDNEQTFADLHARIQKVRDYLASLPESAFQEAQSDRIIPVPYPPGKGLPLDEYLVMRQIPNVYFHICAAYLILRSNGVPLGKTDYLGPLPFLDA